MKREGRSETPGGGSVCPAAHGGWLSTPARKLIQNPERILNGWIEPGQTAVDLGCGSGFFTLALAKRVGPAGRVIGVDLQEGMLAQAKLRAERSGLLDRITLHRCGATGIGLQETADFALAFYMVHEVPDVAVFLGQVRALVKPGGRFLLVEPVFHVTKGRFEKTVELARAAGFEPAARLRIAFSRSVLFRGA